MTLHLQKTQENLDTVYNTEKQVQYLVGILWHVWH